jgi:hypothetical protein
MKMKRAAFLLLASGLLASCTTLPPWKTVPDGQAVVYGQIEDSRRSLAFIAFANDPGVVAIAVENRFGGFMPRYGMIVDEPARASIHEAIAKYQEWSRLAVDNQVEITREISTISLPQMFRRGDAWEAEGSRDVTFVFNSRLGQSDSPRVTLLMRTRSFFYGMDQVLLSDQQAADLDTHLSTDEINAAYEKAKKKQDTLDMFK